MVVTFVQQKIHRNLVQRPRVAKDLDGLGRAANRLGLNYATGLTRQKSVLFASTDPVEVQAAVKSLEGQPRLRAWRAINKFEELFQPKSGSAWGAGTTLGNRMTIRAERYVNKIIVERRAEGRLTDNEVIQLGKELSSRKMREYLRGFGYHLGMKALTDILCYAGILLAVGGEWWYSALFISTEVLSRAAYTVKRMVHNRGRDIPLARALIYGLNPFIGGILAFPMQMIGACLPVARLIIGKSALGAARLLFRLPGIHLIFKDHEPRRRKVEDLSLSIAKLMTTPINIVGRRSLHRLQDPSQEM